LEVANDRDTVFLDAGQQQERLKDQVVHLDEALQIVGIVLEPVHRLEDDQNPSISIHLGHNVAAVGAIEYLTVVLDGMAGHPVGMAPLEVVVGVNGLVGLNRIPARIMQELGQQGVLRAHNQVIAL